MRCRYRSVQFDSSLKCCGSIEPQASSRRIDQTLLAPNPSGCSTQLVASYAKFLRALGSRTSIRFDDTDREAGQCRHYHLAPEVSKRSGDAKLPSSWQGQQCPETRSWSPALWADYEATTAQGPNVSSRRLRTGAADPLRAHAPSDSKPGTGRSNATWSQGLHVECRAGFGDAE